MNKKITKELQRISKSIPKELKDNIVKEVRRMETSNELYEKLKANPDENPDALRKLQILKDGGYLDEMEAVENKDVTKKIDAYLEEQINRSIKLGRLPDKEELNKLLKKSQKYARKHNKEIQPVASKEKDDESK